MRKGKVSFCLILVLLVLFGACSKKAAGVKGTSVDYVSLWNEGEPQITYMREMIAAFEKEKGITVNLTPAGRDILTKIKSRLLMKDPPDLVDQDFNELNAALVTAKEIMVQPITSLFDEKGPEGQSRMMDIFPKNLIRLYEIGGELYYFPYNLVTSGFFYDKALFRANGLNPPKTWDEFIAVNQALKAKGIPALALDGTIQFYNAYYYYWALQRVMGSGFLKTAATDKTGETWKQPGYLKAARLVYELSKTQKNLFQDGYEGSNWPAAQVDWAQGKSGSVLCGTWIPVETEKQVKSGFEFGFYPFPEVAGGAGRTSDVEAYLIGFAIPKDAKNAEGAKEFIRFVSRKANAEHFVALSMNMSARTDIGAPGILSDVKPVIAGAKSFHKIYDGALADIPEWFANVFYPLDNSLIFGKITPEEFISQISAKTAEYWAGK